MRWSLFRWTWQLESPLYVGMAPAGSLNRCRLYVPARALWGAVTAEIARSMTGSEFPKYQNFGDQIRKDVRFTYLFPAEQEPANWYAWLPRYEREIGLTWKREGGKHELSDRSFRTRLLSTRPSTAIDPSSDAAADGSLRETECINTSWRAETGFSGGPVGLVGYVFVRELLADRLRHHIERLQFITVGGDARYGLGRLRRAHFEESSEVFGFPVDVSADDPKINANHILAHADINTGNQLAIWGALELLSGWDRARGERYYAERPLWMPGSVVGEALSWRVDASGHWSTTSGES